MLAVSCSLEEPHATGSCLHFLLCYGSEAGGRESLARSRAYPSRSSTPRSLERQRSRKLVVPPLPSCSKGSTPDRRSAVGRAKPCAGSEPHACEHHKASNPHGALPAVPLSSGLPHLEVAFEIGLKVIIIPHRLLQNVSEVCLAAC